MHMRNPAFLVLTLALFAWTPPAQAAQRVAVFDFELIDTSLDGAMYGTQAAETARLKMISERLRKDLENSGKFEVVDIAPVEAAARANNLQACGGCDVSLAEKVGADLSITGTVQKVSNLILNMNIYIRDAHTKTLISSTSADFRGNTDESWARSLSFLVRNYLLAPNFGTD